MYDGYAWLTNAVPPRALAQRLLILLGMAGFLLVALAIPTAFGRGGVALGLGYLLVTLVHTGMFLLSAQESAVRAMRRLGPANAVAAALWWLYFDGEDERAEAALGAATPARTSWLALYGFGYAFLPVLGGIIVFAAGVKDAVVRYGAPLGASTAWFLAAGVAGYIAGLAWFRRLLGTGPVGARLLLAGVALPSVAVRRAVSAGAPLAAPAPGVGAGVVTESAWQRRRRAAARG